MDISDRQLRNVVVGLGGKVNGVPMESGFDITVASEIMAILCLAQNMSDLKERLGKLIVAYTYDGKPVCANQLGVVGSMAVLLKDAIKPNLVQTLEGQPAFVHGGPFANIAHGNNSVIATRMALRLADYVVTEGGFAADLGAEKFFNIVCRYTDLRPDVVVLVASIRALNMHGGVSKERVTETNLEALEKGCANLDKHIENISKFGLPVVVAINRFPTDDGEELALVKNHCDKIGVPSSISEVVSRGGEGGVQLAKTVLDVLQTQKSNFRTLYDVNQSIREKIGILATELYGADGVTYTKEAERDIKAIEAAGLANLPLCMAKTQSSLSDDANLKGAPKGWTLTVREVRASAGAGFLVPITGTMLTMPGLPKHPAAEKVDIDEEGRIVGLF
jgi:formate--tetrahydrofolate ligase